MTVLVDTSVWVDFFNGHPSPETLVLARMIDDEEDLATCGVVMAEFFQGLRDAPVIPRLELHFREMRYLAPRDPDTYLHAARLFRELRARGVTVRSTVDCLIARLAEEHDARLLAKDRDMRQILASGLCRVRAVASGGG